MINKQLVGSGRLAGTGWVGQREGGGGGGGLLMPTRTKSV